MRYVVSFRDSYSDGLLLFTATDTKDAYRFIRENTNFDMCTVSTPIPLRYAESNRIANQGVKLE